MGIISKITGLFTKKKPQAELDIINILHGIFEESEVQDKTLHFPDWNITVIPEVQRAQETSVYFSFQITSPEWDQPLYERSMGLGENQEKATGMALGGFVFGIMDVIKQMMKDRGHVCGDVPVIYVKECWSRNLSGINIAGESMRVILLQRTAL